MSEQLRNISTFTAGGYLERLNALFNDLDVLQREFLDYPSSGILTGIQNNVSTICTVAVRYIDPQDEADITKLLNEAYGHCSTAENPGFQRRAYKHRDWQAIEHYRAENMAKSKGKVVEALKKLNLITSNAGLNGRDR